MKTAPAQTHAERATTLASLPSELQISLIEHHARRLDTAWLQSAQDDGHFDVMDEEGQQSALQKFSAAATFLQTTACEVAHTDPKFGPLDLPCVHLVASPSLAKPQGEGFRTFYAGLVAHVVDQVQRMQHAWPERHTIDSEDHAVWGRFDQDIDQAFAKAMVACVALDLPESVRLLAETQPSSMRVFLPVPETLGDQAMRWDRSAFVHQKPAQLTPYAMAMAFSHTQAMQALVDAGFNVLSMAHSVLEGAALDSVRSNVFDIMDFWQQAPVMGTPSAIQTALTHRMQVQKDFQTDALSMSLLACESLLPTSGANSRHVYRDAFHAVGAFEIHPWRTVMQAVLMSDARELQRLESTVAWQSFETLSGVDGKNANQHFIMRAVADVVGRPERREACESALVTLIEKTVADGQFDFVMGPIPVKTSVPVDMFKTGNEESVRMQPMAWFIDNGLSRVVAKMMDQGVDVRRPLAEGALPLLEYAEQKAQEKGVQHVLHTMRAHLARSAAHSLLAEMGCEPTKATPQ